MTTEIAPVTLGGRYQLGEQIGVGGMGIVYRALDRLTQQTVALKRVLVKAKQSDGGFDRRLALAQEFQTLASLRHPHIINVLDYGFDAEQQPFFTMELLESPQTILTFGAQQSPVGKVRLLVQMLQALAYLHRRGILHRDLKPANVLVVNAQVKLLDFGLTAVPSDAHQIVGTPAYMAPELLLGQPVTAGTDLYAVGVLAYELFVGRHPFETHDLQQLMAQILRTLPDLSGLDGVTDETIVLSSDPDSTLAASSALMPKIDDLLSRTVQLPPFKADFRLYKDTPQKPALSLGQAIQRLLAKSPQDRYTDALSVISDLSMAVGEPLPVETEATRESFIQAARFIGREAELSQLSDALKDAQAKHGSLWLVSGESGVGKSRLLDELRIRALVQGALVLRGQASATGEPYQLWREPLRRLILTTPLNDTDAAILKTILPDIDESLQRPISTDPEQAQKQLLAVIMSLFYRQTQPIVLVLEDLQTARSESLAVLEQLHAAAGDLPLLIVGSYRDDERFELPVGLAQAHWLKLKRLTADKIVELSESMLGAAGRQPQITELLQRETEGNVFFVVEVVRALAEEAGQLDRIGSKTLPSYVFTGGVQRIIQRRLERVPSNYYVLLELAAVLGRQLDLTLLGSLYPQLDAALLACADAAVLEYQNEAWRFSHDKLREGVLMGLGSEARAALHSRVARAIEAIYPDSADRVAALAYHWHISENKPKEAHYALLAGEQAYRVSAYSEAALYFERVMRLLTVTTSPEDETQQLVARIGLAKANTRMSLFNEATTLLERARDQAKSFGNGSVLAEILAEMGRIALYQGHSAEANQKLNEGLQLARSLGDKHRTANILATLGRLALEQGDYAEAIEHYHQSLTLAQESGEVWETAHALGGLGVVAASQGSLDEARQHLQAALTLYKQIGNREGVAGLSLTLSYAMLAQGNPTEAAKWANESLIASREIGDRRGIANSLNNLGYIALMQTSFVEARQYLEESLQILEKIEDEWGAANTLANLGHVANGLSDARAAKTRFYAALQRAQGIGALPLILEIIAGLARAELLTEKPERALTLIAFVQAHPNHNADHQALAEPILADLQQRLPAETVQTALAATSQPELNQFVEDLIAQYKPFSS